MRKNLLKIPAQILQRINAFELDDVVAACVKRLQPADVANYAHLGLTTDGTAVTAQQPAVPDPRRGKFSRINVEGKEIVRDDLPKVSKTYSVETPNWGDWSNGSHTMEWDRMVYQREFLPPKELQISVEVLEQRAGGPFVVKFAVEQVLGRRSPDFEAELLYNLNLLQENVGAVGVFESGATLAEYTKTVQIDWEILPPGKVDDVMAKMLVGKRAVSEEQRNTMKSRLQEMAKYKPQAYIAGTNGFLRYFGAQFRDDLVVFENLAYGNALYVMHEDWIALSRKSRIDLLKGPPDGFERILHTKGWKERLKRVLEDYLDSEAD